MPLKFWDEAFITATYLINRVPSKVIQGQTFFELLLKQKPDYLMLRTFGCACWPNLRPYNNRKLQFRSKQCVFLGYNNLHKGFKCLDITEGRVYISRDVVFDEDVYPFASLHSNAGAILRSEILLLSPTLLNPSIFGDNNTLDSTSNDSLHTNSTCESAENSGQNDAGLEKTGGLFVPPGHYLFSQGQALIFLLIRAAPTAYPPRIQRRAQHRGDRQCRCRDLLRSSHLLQRQRVTLRDLMRRLHHRALDLLWRRLLLRNLHPSLLHTSRRPLLPLHSLRLHQHLIKGQSRDFSKVSASPSYTLMELFAMVT
jgi:hypothetical protein